MGDMVDLARTSTEEEKSHLGGMWGGRIEVECSNIGVVRARAR